MSARIQTPIHQNRHSTHNKNAAVSEMSSSAPLYADVRACCSHVKIYYYSSFVRSFVRSFIHQEPIFKYVGHVCRYPNTTLTKGMLLAKSRRPYKRDPSKSHSTAQNTGHRSPGINHYMSPWGRQSGLHKIRVVLLHWSTV